jgi:hypothetical protein
MLSQQLRVQHGNQAMLKLRTKSRVNPTAPIVQQLTATAKKIKGFCGTFFHKDSIDFSSTYLLPPKR